MNEENKIVPFGKKCPDCGDRIIEETTMDCSKCKNKVFQIVGENIDKNFKIIGFRCAFCREFYPADEDD